MQSLVLHDVVEALWFQPGWREEGGTGLQVSQEGGPEGWDDVREALRKVVKAKSVSIEGVVVKVDV